MSHSKKDIINTLSEQSTWRLFALAIITLGVYPAHYIKRQSGRLNSFLKDNDQISPKLCFYIFVFSYLRLVLVSYYLAYGENEFFDIIEVLVDALLGGVLLIWVFEARNKVTRLLNLNPEDPNQLWFHGGWTFFFNVFYFNLKVNDLAYLETQLEEFAISEPEEQTPKD